CARKAFTGYPRYTRFDVW
nr:immunoglobulin heavy chain junction region [Macaca mulatta]MOV42217.1 immunoglobulin heavy chain junction region [Macaca mulatta]MOV46774.1 immunoglobulin heavy chain junction region [Macaca mulatta]